MKKSLRKYIIEIAQEYYNTNISDPNGGGHQHYGNVNNCRQLIGNYLNTNSAKKELLNKVQDLVFSIDQNTYKLYSLGLDNFNNIKISRIRNINYIGIKIENNVVTFSEYNDDNGEYSSIKIDAKDLDDNLVITGANVYWDSIMLSSLLADNEYNVELIESNIKELNELRLEKDKELQDLISQKESFEWISSFMQENNIDIIDQTVLKTKMALSMFNIEDDAEKEANIYELFQLTV